jgi:hypothetical protein
LDNINQQVNIIILIDTIFTADPELKQLYNDTLKAVRVISEGVVHTGIKVFKPLYTCFESLMLSCVDLLEICEFDIPHKQAALVAYEKLHRDAYSKLLEVDSKGKIYVNTKFVFIEADYASSIGNYGSPDVKTLERRFKLLLKDITWREGRQSLALCVPSSMIDKLGICWIRQTNCGRQFMCCRYCYLGKILAISSPVARLEYFVHKSYIKNYFDFLIWQK